MDFLEYVENALVSQNVATSVGTVVLVIGLLIAVVELRMLIQTTKRENYRRRKEYALDYSLTKSETLVAARTALARVFGATVLECADVSIEEMERAWDPETGDPAVQSHLRTLLSHWENMALAIHRGVADEATAFEMVGVRVFCTVRQYRAYIDARRRETPASYKHLLALYDKWKLKVQRRYSRRRAARLSVVPSTAANA